MMIQWAAVDDTQIYNVTYAASTGSMQEEDKVWVQLEVDQPEIFLRNLTPNTFYEIHIRATNVYTESLPASVKKFTKLAVPENVTIANLTDTIIKLSWSPVEGCKDYKFGISKHPLLPESFRKSTRTTEFSFEMLSSNQAYNIWMKATNVNTESDIFRIKQFTKLPQPEKVMFTPDDIHDRTLRLRWRVVKESEYYSIIVMALHNESSPSSAPPFDQDSLVTEIDMKDGIPLVEKRLRGRRAIEDSRYAGRTIRSTGADATAKPISFKTKRGMKKPQQVFINEDGLYEITVTETDVTFSQLDPGVKYNMILRAVNRDTESIPVKIGTFTKLQKPGSNDVETRKIDNDTAAIVWLPVNKASYYRVIVTSERKPFMKESDVIVAEGITTDTEMSIVGLEPNTKYTFAVRAGNNHIESYAATIWNITKLSAVEDLLVDIASITSSSFMVRWAPVEHAGRYVILISPPMMNRRNKIMVAASETKVTLEPLRDTTNYKVTISAENDRTNGVTRQLTQYTKLLTPANVQIVLESVNSSYFRVVWDSVRAAEEYHVRLWNDTNKPLKQLKPKKTQAQLKNLLSGHKYWVTIKAHNKKHKTYSDEVKLTTFTKLVTPENFEVIDAEVTDTSLVFSWDPVPLADRYKITSVIKPRDNDHVSIHLHVNERTMLIEETFIEINNLRPASYYSVVMKAINLNTDSENVSLSVFTKLSEPTNLTLHEHLYMDTEAKLEWFQVQRAGSYVIEVFTKPEKPDNITDEEFYESDILDILFMDGSDNSYNESIVYENRTERHPYHTVIGLEPLTTYVAAVSAKNKDTNSDRTTMEFKTKSACEEDFHAFPHTHLYQALHRREVKNVSLDECLTECCEERKFPCRSVSLHKETSDCYLFAEDRNIAPPLGLSKYYDHFERKFWQEVSGFQIRSLSHNNVAVINETVDIILTFVYVGKTGCVEWDLGEGTRRYHAISSVADCAYMCDNAPPGTNCTILPANPLENANQINTSHVYDMNSVYEVRVNVSDQGIYATSSFKIAINERGCIYPEITIEEDAKNILDPKQLYRSNKLVLSTTPTIVCKSFPGVKFDWRAVVYSASSNTVTNSFQLDSFGSEILIPALSLELGMYMITATINLLDDEHDLQDSDSVYIEVVPSPLVSKIKGGSMRTIGYNRIVKWDASTKSYDPDTLGPERHDLSYRWFCKNYTDTKFQPLEDGSCFPDLDLLTFDGPGIFILNTTIMHLYVNYEFQVAVMKDERTTMFTQQVVVKEGDPPEFYIECRENCKAKLNPTQALALNAICLNCKHERNPEYEWILFEVITISDEQESESDTESSDKLNPILDAEYDEEELDYDEVKSVVSEEGKVEKKIYEQVMGWEGNTTTGSMSDILVLTKNSLKSGREYVLRLNVSMDGLDDRVHSFSDFTFLSNLPPYNGICSTASSIGNCARFKTFPNTQIDEIDPRGVFVNLTEKECSQKCCLMREFLCLSFTYQVKERVCKLYTEARDTILTQMSFSNVEDYHQRVFYVGRAVIDEVLLECRNWQDEGELQTYPKEGERPPKTTLTYKYVALPYGNLTSPLLLYFGTVVKTPGISMALGDPEDDYIVSIRAQVCDMYGECAMSNTVTIQVVPPDSGNVGDTLSGFANGNTSKLGIFSSTGNSKAAAQLVQSIASIINMNEEEEDRSLGSNGTGNATDYEATTSSWLETTASPTTAYYVTMGPETNVTGNASRGVIDKNLKQNLRKDVVKALSSASGGMTSIDNLKQMTSAMNSITKKPDEITPDSQLEASNTVLKMAASLTTFSDESNKEDIADAAKNIIGSLGSVAKSSETNMGDLKDQLLQPSELNFNTLDNVDLSPDEFEYYNRLKLKQEKKRVRRSALASQEVMASAITAIDGTADSLLDKQMSGEPAENLNSERMEMQVEKSAPEDIGNRELSTARGSSIKLPGADVLFGKNATNMTEPVNIQVMAFDDNPLGFGDDAALINSPITMLKIGGANNNGSTGNDTENEGDDRPGVGISIPSKFDPLEDMMTIERDINDTGLSISKFEMVSQENAILILVEPEDERSKFEVLLRFNSKPTEEEYDFKFKLPHDAWDVTMAEDRYKIFIPEKEVKMKGMIFIGIQDNLNVSTPIAKHRGRVRRRRSIGIENSTTYHLLISTPGCRRFDSETNKWTGDGCKVSEHSTPEFTECVCNKLSPTSIFSAEFFVPPNTINFATVFAKIDIADNPAVFSTVISLIILYILLLIWARRTDKKDRIKWSLKSVVDNRKEDKYLYQVTVFTGYGRDATTHSNVFCIIFGEHGRTNVRQLRVKEEKMPFTRSSVNHFLLRVDKSLGNLTHVHIWHDNTGKGNFRGWYLDQVAVQDVVTGERFYFVCDQWLAVDQDDGLVDRILPVATPENMSSFHRLFLSTTSQKFTEDHLWISIFYRPTKSTFTRVQRLSCCICLLFLTMIANAMWFESGSRSGSSGTSTLKVGPFVVSPIQVWTSFCSTLMVVPVVTLVMMLFKKAKTKDQEDYEEKEKKRREQALNKIRKRQHAKASTLPNPSELVGKDAVYTIDDQGRIHAKEKTKRAALQTVNTWPHWCVYIAWVLVVLAVLCSGFFAILYSFEWGRVKANRWLCNMMLSFWQSVLIVQPIKVIFLSMFVAAIVRKPDEQVMDSVQDKDVDEAEQKFMNLCADNIESEMQQNELSPPKPPSKKRLKRARKLRAKERAMSDIIWEVVVYFFYIMVLLFLCHGNRDSKAFHITNSIKKTFVNPKYGLQSVNSVEYFWRFMNVTLLPNLYPVAWYNGDPKTWRERSFLVDEQSYRVGPARMRQVRVKASACPHSSPSQKECRAQYSLFNNDEVDYVAGWVPLDDVPLDQRPQPDPDDEEDAQEDPLTLAWKYRDWEELNGMPCFGELTAYPGGGYSAELGVNYMTGRLIMDQLYQDVWIDHRTRAVFTEFTVYNPNVNLFTTVNLISEFPPMGAAVHFTNVVSFRLYHYVGSFGTLVVFAQAIFVLHLLYSTYKSIKLLVQLKKKFFFDPWNIFESIIVFFDWTIVGLSILRHVMTDKTIAAFHENKRKYVNFQQVTTVDSLVGYVLSISAFMGILRFMKLLRFNKRIGMLSSVLKYSARQWPGFFVLAAVFFISFVHVGYVVFCPFLDDFKNLLSTAETMVDTMMGRHTYPLLRETYRFFGPIYYFVFCFLATFIIMNVLIAIIGESHKHTNADLEKAKNQYDVIDFMLKRFMKWSGIGRYMGGRGSGSGKKPSKEEQMNETLKASPSGDVVADDNSSEFERPNQMIEFQKKLDEYAYDLENKYKKLLSFDELRNEVVSEMKLARDEQKQKLDTEMAHAYRRRTTTTQRDPSAYSRPGPSNVRTISGRHSDTSSMFAAKRY
ncbi:polycystin family receptor for egg jelly-like isoform X1 [Styela clava]